MDLNTTRHVYHTYELIIAKIKSFVVNIYNHVLRSLRIETRLYGFLIVLTLPDVILEAGRFLVVDFVHGLKSSKIK